MSANDRQHGGKHYQTSDYQHWDWVTDCRLTYLAGNGTKYAFRFPDKNGLEDVEKAIHYCDKAEERGTVGSSVANRYDLTWKFIHANLVDMRRAHILFMMLDGSWPAARAALQEIALELQPEGLRNA